MKNKEDVLNEIIMFFSDKFEFKINDKGYKYAAYKTAWLNELNLIATKC